MSFTLALFAAAATPFADLDAIDRAAAAFAGGETAPIDRRLRLAPCGGPLALSWQTSRQDTVVVRCPDAGWRLFVPARRSSAADAAPVVNRGDAVSLVVSGEGFSVSQAAEALESGAAGAWIRVRSARAGAGGEPMRARIVRPGLVEVPLD